ncbi:MAG: hypothetical protein AAFN79_12990 [Pseudomonadota bacterium]
MRTLVDRVELSARKSWLRRALNAKWLNDRIGRLLAVTLLTSIIAAPLEGKSEMNECPISAKGATILCQKFEYIGEIDNFEQIEYSFGSKTVNFTGVIITTGSAASFTISYEKHKELYDPREQLQDVISTAIDDHKNVSKDIYAKLDFRFIDNPLAIDSVSFLSESEKSSKNEEGEYELEFRHYSYSTHFQVDGLIVFVSSKISGQSDVGDLDKAHSEFLSQIKFDPAQ